MSTCILLQDSFPTLEREIITLTLTIPLTQLLQDSLPTLKRASSDVSNKDKSSNISLTPVYLCYEAEDMDEMQILTLAFRTYQIDLLSCAPGSRASSWTLTTECDDLDRM